MDKLFDIKDLEGDINNIFQDNKNSQQPVNIKFDILRNIYNLSISVDEKISLLCAHMNGGGALKLNQKRVSLAIDSSIFQLFNGNHNIIALYASIVIIKKIALTKEFLEMLDITNIDFKEELKTHLSFFISNMNRLMTKDPIMVNIRIPRCMFCLVQGVLNQQGLLTIEAFLASFVSISIKLL